MPKEVKDQDNSRGKVLRQAAEFLRKGNFVEAERLYLRILAAEPANFDASHLLGIVRFQQGRAAEALELIGTALRVKPEAAVALSNYANILKAVGRFEEALASYDKALTIEPDYAEALYNRGNTLVDLKRSDEALVSYSKALAIKPDYFEALYNQGNTLRDLKRFEEALTNYDKVLAIKPDFATALNNRGNTLSDLDRFEEALHSYDRAIALKPDYAKAHNNRGNVLQVLNRFEEALWSHNRAIELDPDYAEAYSNRATALQDMRRLNEALQSCDRAIKLSPDFAVAYSNKGNILQDLKRLDEALQSYDRAIELNPDYAEAYWNKGLCNLLMNRFDEGWRLCEWRKRRSVPIASRTYSQRAWLGEEGIEGKTLFIYSEQGLGDTIQFCRYAKLAEAMGAKVILSAQDVLMRLLKELSPTVKIVGSRTTPSEFDFHIPLLSMPLAFKTGRNSVPAQTPYLRSELDQVKKWKEIIGSDGFKVGICWQGNPRGTVDIGRSFPISYYEALSRIPHVRLISLQKGAGAEQILNLPAGMKVETLGDGLDEGSDAFIDTAAVIENVDLVITPDTAIAHLAGALGRPTWVALRYVPDWRWLLDRTDSPWYPTVRLFRQPSEGDWSKVFVDIESEVLKLAAT